MQMLDSITSPQSLQPNSTKNFLSTLLNNIEIWTSFVDFIENS